MLHGLSVLVLRIGDHEQSLSTAREGVAVFRTSSDRRALAEELHHLGTVTWVFSDYDGAERWCEESRMVAEDAGEPASVASVIHTLGVIAASRNNTATGRELIAHSIELLRALPSNGEPLLARGGRKSARPYRSNALQATGALAPRRVTRGPDESHVRVSGKVLQS